MSDLYWTQRDGTRIRPEDMTFEHRRATIAMMMRNAKAIAGELVDEYWNARSDFKDFTFLAMDYEELANDDKQLFELLVAHRPVIGRMAELNNALIKGEQK